MAGLYYAYSCSVNPGLGKLPDVEYIGAMQSINLAIQNPLFFAGFFGPLILLPVSAWLSYAGAPSTRFYLLLAAAISYAVCSFGITMFGNVPLNNALAAFNIKAAGAMEIKAARIAFEGRWNGLHTVRTLATILALVLAVLGCFNTPVRIAK